MHRDQIKMENYGAVEEQLHADSFSDLDLPLTIGFSDHVSLSDSSVQHRAIAQDDPHTEVTERPRKRRNQTAQTHNLAEKKRRDKIKDRMKVLQELIPNSQKLDRASLIEEVISHIKTLQWLLQIMQGTKSYPNLFPPLLQYAQATKLPTFVLPIPSNMGFRNANMSTIQQHFAPGNLYTLPFWHSIPGNLMSMPSLPQNPYFQSPVDFHATTVPETSPLGFHE